jgi:hypothetical protein
MEAEMVLALGSGFSSYVLRRYAAQDNRGVVTSVDDSAEWLSVTKNFLLDHGLSTENLIDLKTFRKADGSFQCRILIFVLLILEISIFERHYYPN